MSVRMYEVYKGYEIYRVYKDPRFRDRYVYYARATSEAQVPVTGVYGKLAALRKKIDGTVAGTYEGTETRTGRASIDEYYLGESDEGYFEIYKGVKIYYYEDTGRYYARTEKGGKHGTLEEIYFWIEGPSEELTAQRRAAKAAAAEAVAQAEAAAAATAKAEADTWPVVEPLPDIAPAPFMDRELQLQEEELTYLKTAPLEAEAKAAEFLQRQEAAAAAVRAEELRQQAAYQAMTLEEKVAEVEFWDVREEERHETEVQIAKDPHLREQLAEQERMRLSREAVVTAEVERQQALVEPIVPVVTPPVEPLVEDLDPRVDTGLKRLLFLGVLASIFKALASER